ncbi:hypothetical protein DOTSEDRAFT_23542 [Dothistroma septosporum NZE10]|uniref:Uncharacterized protein n=1 Tax=Dothistroma septosporum (strain NZE10 / CBS 128990) TaxID=675120 RepID=N1PT32_DOTSN|nr:hypothetical protein DOTSEDRAFT_23542 [Dothistroma septosporum NZE10]
MATLHSIICYSIINIPSILGISLTAIAFHMVAQILLVPLWCFATIFWSTSADGMLMVCNIFAGVLLFVAAFAWHGHLNIDLLEDAVVVLFALLMIVVGMGSGAWISSKVLMARSWKQKRTPSESLWIEASEPMTLAYNGVVDMVFLFTICGLLVLYKHLQTEDYDLGQCVFSLVAFVVAIAIWASIVLAITAFMRDLIGVEKILFGK